MPKEMSKEMSKEDNKKKVDKKKDDKDNSDVKAVLPKDNYSELRTNQTQRPLEMMTSNLTLKQKKEGAGGAFAAYNLCPEILKAIKTKGYNMPTPI